MSDNFTGANDFEIREKIIDAAKRLMIADGIMIITIDDIVKEAGVTEEIFKKYFNDKNELLFELINIRFGIVSDDVLNMPLREKIKYFNLELMKQVELADVETCRQWIVHQFTAENKTCETDMKHIKNLIESSIANGELRDDTPVDELVRFATNAIYGLVFYWAVAGKEFEPLYHIEAVSDFIVNAMIPYMTNNFKQEG